ncbi:MAG TPA: phage tail protein [Bryobacteraceae bacterium]|nr:phage tail protein [Bryobacteraceae bacterium]
MAPGYLYLNVANQWPGFDLHGGEIAADGALQLATSGSQFVTGGTVLGGPVVASDASTDWFRVSALADDLPAGAHVQFFTATTDAGAPPFDPASSAPFADPAWNPLPRDVFEGIVANGPGTQLWLGLVLRSQGEATPRIHQVRADYGRDTYMTWLPAIYRRQPQSGFLERYLALNGSILGAVEDEIAGLPGLFDAFSAPAGGYPSWLDWLSGWLAFDLEETWTEKQKRRFLSEAFELYGWRATIAGLRRYLEIYAGVRARIVELSRFAQIWSLGEAYPLGFGTRLAPGPLQGAVLGSSAVVDQARVPADDDCGASLFEDVAHAFCVQVYSSDLTRPGALELVRRILDQEKPAHTVYRLSVIEPTMRVGAQASIGIDTIIAAGPPPAQIGMPLGGRALAPPALPCDNPGGLDS